MTPNDARLALCQRSPATPLRYEGNCQYDVNCDGSIDPLDSGFVLARFGTCEVPPGCDICD